MLYLCDYTIIKFTPLDRLYLNIIKICARLESASANCDPLHSTIKPASPRFCDRCRPLAFMNNKLVGERRFVQLFLHARSASKLWNSRKLSAYAYSVVSLSLSLSVVYNTTRSPITSRDVATSPSNCISHSFTELHLSFFSVTYLGGTFGSGGYVDRVYATLYILFLYLSCLVFLLWSSFLLFLC